jgi:hypothetical protein
LRDSDWMCSSAMRIEVERLNARFRLWVFVVAAAAAARAIILKKKIKKILNSFDMKNLKNIFNTLIYNYISPSPQRPKKKKKTRQEKR